MKWTALCGCVGGWSSCGCEGEEVILCGCEREGGVEMSVVYRGGHFYGRRIGMRKRHGQDSERGKDSQMVGGTAGRGTWDKEGNW